MLGANTPFLSRDDLQKHAKSEHKPKPAIHRIKEMTITPGVITSPAVALFHVEDATVQPDYEDLFEQGGGRLRAVGTSSVCPMTPRS